MITRRILEFSLISLFGTYVKANGQKEKPQYMKIYLPLRQLKIIDSEVVLKTDSS